MLAAYGLIEDAVLVAMQSVVAEEIHQLLC